MNQKTSSCGWYHRLVALLHLKLRFALTSALATAIDYGLYVCLVYTLFSPVVSHVLSYSIAVGVNFVLQRRFIFSLQRKLSHAFVLAMGVSLGGLALGTALIWALTQHLFFNQYQYLTKLLVTTILFFYNFYMKRYAFEKRFL